LWTLLFSPFLSPPWLLALLSLSLSLSLSLLLGEKEGGREREREGKEGTHLGESKEEGKEKVTREE